MAVKLRDLEAVLEHLQGFKKPKPLLEQYMTSAEITSQILYSIQNSFQDIEGKIVFDLGCGCGAFSVGAAIMGSPYAVLPLLYHIVMCSWDRYVLGIDIDSSALAIARSNAKLCDVQSEIDFLHADVNKLCLDALESLKPDEGISLFLILSVYLKAAWFRFPEHPKCLAFFCRPESLRG